MKLLVKNALFTILFPGTFGVLLPWLVAGRPAIPPPTSWRLPQSAGLGLALGGAALCLACVGLFAVRGRGTPAPIDPPSVLVAQGPYRWVRNPMYWGVGLVILGQAAFHGAGSLIVYFVVAAAIAHLFVLLYEEPTLRRNFGASYESYLRKVPRWLPRPLRPGSGRPSS